MVDKIQTLHPATDKTGVNIDISKYEQIKVAMILVLERDGGKNFVELVDAIKTELPKFDGSINWYAESVKLDLEARGRIVHDRKMKPSLVCLK